MSYHIYLTMTLVFLCKEGEEKCCSEGNWRTINCQRLFPIMQTNFNVAQGADKRALSQSQSNPEQCTMYSMRIIFHWADADIIPELRANGKQKLQHNGPWNPALASAGWCVPILAINADYTLMSEGLDWDSNPDRDQEQ